MGCSGEACFSEDLKELHKGRNPMSKLSKVARGFCRSTEDLCKSTNLYKSWDQRQMIKSWRHAAWVLLREHNVVCAVWLDEVLAFHGNGKSLGDYYLLVHNPNIAAGVLSLFGYRLTGWSDDQSPLSQFHCQRIKMSAPGASVDVVLLSATEWCYDLSPDALHDDLCPYLPEFIDSMMELWLKVPIGSESLYSSLMEYLSVTIHECYMLNDFGEDVCENDYSTWLRPHHREIHFDIVARAKGLVKDNLDFQSRHKYHVHKSNLIRQGIFCPKPRRKKPFKPQLPNLIETPEDTKPTLRSTRGSFMISHASIGMLPACAAAIGIAL